MAASKGPSVFMDFADGADAALWQTGATAYRRRAMVGLHAVRRALYRLFHSSFAPRSLLLVLGDVAITALSLSLVLPLAFAAASPHEYLRGLVFALPLFLVVKIPVLSLYGIYRGEWRRYSLREWGNAFNALLLSEFLLLVLFIPSRQGVTQVLPYPLAGLPLVAFPLDGVLSILMMGALRAAKRISPEAILAGNAGRVAALTVIPGAKSREEKRIFLSPPHINEETVKPLVEEVFASNWMAPLGPQVDAFERELCERVGMAHAVALNSGTAALHLALRALGVGPGDEVIAPSLTFIGGVSPVLFQGARLSFIDSERISWNMDARLLQEELEERNRKNLLPKAVICTDIYGQCADYDAIREVCAGWGVPVVIDAAESLGASYKGRSAGAGGQAAIYSFNGNKIITTSGGGMLVSNDKELIERARFWSQQAKEPAAHYEHMQIGYNYRMSNLLAAVGRGQLQVLGERVLQKRRIFDFYERELASLPGIEFMPDAAYGKANRWLTVLLIDPERFGADREELRLALETHNIESRPVWKPMHLQPVFAGVPMRGGAVCEDFFARGLCLPSGTSMTDEDMSRVVEVIKDMQGMHTVRSEDQYREFPMPARRALKHAYAAVAQH